jgi:hypothetical protein
LATYWNHGSSSCFSENCDIKNLLNVCSTLAKLVNFTFEKKNKFFWFKNQFFVLFLFFLKTIVNKIKKHWLEPSLQIWQIGFSFPKIRPTGANDFFFEKPFVCVQIIFFRSKNAKKLPP